MQKNCNMMEKITEPVSDELKKKRIIRPSTVNQRSNSIGPAAPRTRSAIITKTFGERRSQSLSPLKHTKKNLQQVPPSALGLFSASFPATIDISKTVKKHEDDKPLKPLPQFVVSKMTRDIVAKKREFFKLRKALISQQNIVLEQYANLKELEARIGAHDDEGVGELRVISVTSWPAHDLLMLVRHDIDALTHTEFTGFFGPQVVNQLKNVLNFIPTELYGLATELMARRIDVLTLLRSKLGVERSASAFVHPEWKARNVEFDQETELLHSKVTEMVENVKSKINYALELAKIPWLDRESMNKKIERLQRENLELQNKSFPPDVVKKDKDDLREESKTVNSNCLPFQAVCNELQKERSAKEALKSTVATAENMLRVARARIATLERQVMDARTQHDATIRKQKDIEQLLRQRDLNYDARTRKLQEVSKSSEATITALTHQRDALELRVRELQSLVEQRERGSEDKYLKERSRADSLQAKVAVQDKDIEAAERRVAELQGLVKELEAKHRELEEHSLKLIEVEKKRCLEFLPTKENEPSVRETDIWTDLQTTRMSLSRAEKELQKSRADKDSFLNSLSRIAQGEGPDGLEDKMSIELLEKEQTISKLKITLDKYQENEQIMEKSIAQYETEIAALKFEVKRLRNYDCYSKEVKFQELQTELLDLHIKVECLTRERSALVSAAASRALMLERHERAAELFASVTRVRREIAALIDGTTEPPQMDQAVYAEISRSLSSVCASAADTWSALRSERARVLRLERAVLSQSLQLEREGRARSQLEHRRAQLERMLIHNGHIAPQASAGAEPTLVLKLPSSVNYKGKCFLLNTDS